MTHTEHAIAEAVMEDCWEGECDHEADECPTIDVDTCIDCMDEAGLGREPDRWEDCSLMAWPCPQSADSKEQR